MKLKVHLHKNQRVIVFCVSPNSDGEKLEVSYSYLCENGELGNFRTKFVWDCDFYEKFLPTEELVEIKWLK